MFACDVSLFDWGKGDLTQVLVLEWTSAVYVPSERHIVSWTRKSG